jgi:small-conductance mechanosensitive channel
MVRHHHHVLEQRAYRVLLVLAIFGWLLRLLNRLGLLNSTLSLAQAILATNLERGSISISLGDVLAFLLTVWAAYLLSVFIRFLLQEDVYPRTRITTGESYAISSLLHYVILALGLVVGIGVMGIDLSRLTVLAGAFGVGIGFGLQGVVNNFVCGLILLFERPIHVGDMIEIGELRGEVRRIGIRASIVRTRQGSDMIVPNTQLVTDKVTNWTLSDKLRRISLPVGVNYGADPEEVIELLVKAARAHPRVLPKPEPYALFMSYGDSSINFELRAWTDEYLQWRHVLSDLGVAVYDAVRAAGMTFPFPQSEVRVLHGPEAGPADDWPDPKPEDK